MGLMKESFPTAPQNPGVLTDTLPILSLPIPSPPRPRSAPPLSPFDFFSIVILVWSSYESLHTWQLDLKKSMVGLLVSPFIQSSSRSPGECRAERWAQQRELVTGMGTERKWGWRSDGHPSPPAQPARGA